MMAIIRLTLLEAIRVRLFWLALLFVVAALGLARFLDQVALIESQDIQATVIASIMRTAAAFMVIVFVVTSMLREAGDKVTELLLSQPMSRATYYWGKMAGYILLAAAVGIIMSLPLLVIVPEGALAIWIASLTIELAVVATTSLFCVLSIAQVAPAIAVATGFYLLSRSMGTLQLIAEGAVLHDPTLGDRAINAMIALLAAVLPGLDRMTSGAWFAAPPELAQFGTMTIQAIVFMALLSFASLFDLYRRNF